MAAVRRLAADYLELTKPKVQSLLLLTSITTMEVAGNSPASKIALTCLRGYLSAGGAGAVNHFRDIDARMRRTASRLIPAGRIAPAGPDEVSSPQQMSICPHGVAAVGAQESIHDRTSTPNDSEPC